MAGMMRVPRSRGAISGLLLILLGAWGALVPFIGPYWHYTYTPDSTWHYTTGRLLLQVLPGAGAFLGGVLTLVSANRLTAMLGGWLAAVSGAWFVLGMSLSSIWGSPTIGTPVGGTSRQAAEFIGMFGGLGAAIVFLAAFALGRFAVVGVRETRAADRAAAPAGTDQPAYARTTDDAPARGTTTDGDGHGHRFHWPSSHRHVGAR